jgi:hypothetical protein
MSVKIAASIEKMLEEMTVPISLKWKNDKVGGAQEHYAFDGNVGINLEGENSIVSELKEQHVLVGNVNNNSVDDVGVLSNNSSVINIPQPEVPLPNGNKEIDVDIGNRRTSNRHRELPLTRNKDFLWTSIKQRITK